MVANQAHTLTSFNQLYPDVDPSRPQPLSGFERFVCAAAVAIFSFGCVMGDVVAAGIGLVLLLFAVYTAGHQTARRIRKEARDRFPQIGWAEECAISPQKLLPLLVIFWVIIIGVNLLAFWFATAGTRLWVALATAILTLILVWFMPGLNPVWSRSRRKPEPEPESEPDAVVLDSSAQIPVRGSGAAWGSGKQVLSDETGILNPVETEPR